MLSNKELALLLPSLTFILTYQLLGFRKSSSVRRSRSQVASFAAIVRAIYLFFVKDSTIVGYLFGYQQIRPLFSKKMKLNVNLWLFLSSTQLKSEYPSIISFLSLLYKILQLIDLLRYRKMFLTISKCEWLRFLAKQIAMATKKTM